MTIKESLSALSRCLRAENRKLRGSPLWAAFLVVPLLSAAYGTINYMNNAGEGGLLKHGWLDLWSQHTLFYALFFISPLVALYAATLWRTERVSNAMNVLMTAPVPPMLPFLAKLATLTRALLLTQVWVFLLYSVCGKLAGLPGMPPLRPLLWLLRGTLAGEAVCALQLLLSLCVSAFAPPVLLALGGGIAGMLARNMGLDLFWPYALMLTGMNSSNTQDLLSGGALPFVVSCILFLLLFLFIAKRKLERGEVK